MNKKEIAEIRKQFTPERCSITRICGCYVDGEKNKRAYTKDAFLSIPEEEMFKYLEIFRKTFSGKLNKNMLNMEYSLEQERPGGCHSELLELRNSKLTDDELVGLFYDKVIENYVCAEDYYIILIHGAYDIPGKASDDKEMFDASDDVYEFVLCSICPVKLSKAGLSYDATKNRIENRIRDWVVDVPMHGFLFPAFNDRNTDIHGCLYYCKKNDGMQKGFISNVLGCEAEMSADEQKQAFNDMIMDVLCDSGDIRDVLAIYQNIEDMLLEHEFDTEPWLMDKSAVEMILRESGMDGSYMERFDESWNSHFGVNALLPAENISDGKKMLIECGNAEIKIATEDTGLIRTELINNVPFLRIPVNGVLSVNGISVNKGEE